MTTLGILGSGPLGQAVGKAAVDAGYEVVISNSRGPQTLGDVVAALGAGTRAAPAEEAARAGDLVLVAVRPAHISTLPAEALAGKVVLDAGNYYPSVRDQSIPALDDETTTVSEMLQAHVPEAKVVKAFNHIEVEHIARHASPPGTPGRRALAIAGNDSDAKKAAAEFIDAVGFDVVDLGPLSEGWRVQRDTPAFLYRFDAEELAARASEARRYRDLAPGEMEAINAAGLRYLGYLYEK